MTTMTRFFPFRSHLEGVALTQNWLNSIFNDFAAPSGEMQNESLSAGSFIPPVDIYEDALELVPKMEVPGIPQEDLQISLENQVLTVKGERKFAKDAKEENFHRIERHHGSFSRSFTLPNTINPESTQATHENGVLSLTLKKREALKPKQARINIDSNKTSTSALDQVKATQAA